jgi:MFS family permease
MLVCMAGAPITSIVALLGSGLFFGMGSATIFPIGQTLAGPHAAGKWMGVQNCVGNLAGIIAPFVTGYVVDRTGDFSIAFAIAAAVTIFGIVGWASIPRIETLDWSKRTA